MRIVKKGYTYYEVISETAKFFNARELKFKLAKSEDGFFTYGEGTKYTRVYESGVYDPYYTKSFRFSKAKYEVKEVPDKWETSSISYQG